MDNLVDFFEALLINTVLKRRGDGATELTVFLASFSLSFSFSFSFLQLILLVIFLLLFTLSYLSTLLAASSFRPCPPFPPLLTSILSLASLTRPSSHLSL